MWLTPHILQAGLTENVACLASCDSDGLVNLWSMSSTRPVANLPGHGCRVARLNYHPSGKYTFLEDFGVS